MVDDGKWWNRAEEKSYRRGADAGVGSIGELGDKLASFLDAIVVLVAVPLLLFESFLLQKILCAPAC